jgi:hypothetical protein
MPEIKDSVGEKGKNLCHDVALVQVMLSLAKDAKGTSYLKTYDGSYGNQTHNAITAFQKDHVFVPGYSGTASDHMQELRHQDWIDFGRADRPVATPEATPDLIKPKDATFVKLVSLLPDSHNNIRIIENTKTVYIAGSDDDLTSSKQGVAGSPGLAAQFKVKVSALLEQMFKLHKIVLWLTPPKAFPARRTFQEQYDLLFKVDDDGNPVTHAGPGESNHNFGQAVDIGFNGFRWLKEDSTIVENEDWWFHKILKIKHGKDRMLEMVAAMRAVATDGGLYRGPADDYPHIQAWPDSGVDMARRLAVLMSSVGKMKWTGSMQQYRCDFGAGGAFYAVGSAKRIWNGDASVSKIDLAAARTKILQDAAVKAGGDALKNFKPVKVGDIKPADIQAMQQALIADFQAADADWDSWTPF